MKNTGRSELRFGPAIADIVLLCGASALAHWLFVRSAFFAGQTVPWFVVQEPGIFLIAGLGLAFAYAARMYHRQVVAQRMPWWYQYGKRPVDVAFSLLFLALASPVLALVAIAIKLGSRGPVIFRQLRIGKNLRPFYIHKFRTMRENDRVTAFGRLLRRYSIDEFPQAINVLKGEMSWIGPRPHIPEEVARYRPWQLRKYDVLPGITGLAQVNGRKDLVQDGQAKLDLHYVDNVSLLLDLKILFKTLPTVLTGNGAY